jgi:hypothetical protein
MRGEFNPWNSVLAQRAANLGNAYRHPISPGCDLADPKSTPVQQRASLLTVPIIASAAGDNPLISTLIGKKLIYEVFLWNVTAQTLAFYQGGSGGILLVKLTNFPSTSGFLLGFNGNFAQPHWEIDAGQPLILNLQNSTEVDGFIRYRIATESF